MLVPYAIPSEDAYRKACEEELAAAAAADSIMVSMLGCSVKDCVSVGQVAGSDPGTADAVATAAANAANTFIGP